MAGDRQHYLPQFLQRGFSSSPNGRQTWTYRKSAVPCLVGIRDIGVEQKFYSEAGDQGLDNAITKAEAAEFSLLINSAREKICGVTLEGNFGRLFAHLEVRSRHLRQSFTQIAEDLWRKTLNKFHEAEFLRKLIKQRLRRNLVEQLRLRGVPPHLVDQAVKQVLTPGKLKAMSFKFVPILERDILPRVRAAAKRGHLDALSRSISPGVRSRQYGQLTFRTREVTTKDMILGDSAVVFQANGRESFKPFVDKDETVVAAFLPVTPERVIVGENDNLSVNHEALRTQIAECSLEFFIAAVNSSANANLATAIGENALPLSEEDILKVIEDAIEEHLR